MEETTFTIELADGTQIEGTINGNNYITQQTVTEDMLDDLSLIGMKINDQELDNMTCCNLWTAQDGTHMIFREKSREELAREEINAKLEYIAMMTEVEL